MSKYLGQQLAGVVNTSSVHSVVVFPHENRILLRKSLQQSFEKINLANRDENCLIVFVLARCIHNACMHRPSKSVMYARLSCLV